MFTRNSERTGREKRGLRKHRGVWEWMKKELRQWRPGGWDGLIVAGPAAHFQSRPKVRGFLLLWLPPRGLRTLSLPKAGGSGTQTPSPGPLFGFRPLPLTKMCSLCKTLLVFLLLSYCVGFCQPSKAFLASATPCGHTLCNLLVQFTGQQEPDGVAPQGSAPHRQPPGCSSAPLGFLLKPPLLRMLHTPCCVSICGACFFVFLYSFLDCGQICDTADHRTC